MTIHEDFYDYYDDETFDLVCLDEFKGQKTMQFLNCFLQGGDMFLKKKGSQYHKRKNIPVIILSNWSLDDCYRGDCSSIRSRVTEITLTQPIDLDNIIFEEDTPNEKDEIDQ